MIPQGNFKDFVFRQHRQWCWLALGVLLVQFILLKIWYPHTVFEPDSLSYVHAAAQNDPVYIWPIGYSNFLRIMHLFGRGDGVVAAVQYWSMEMAVLYFYFTTLYFFRPGPWIKGLTLCCLVINPLMVCLSNYILSDALFIAITILWFTLTVWFINRPRPLFIYLMVGLLFLAFTLRYYAIFYPAVTVPVILFSRMSRRVKWTGLALGCLLFISFILYTRNGYERFIHQSTFSPFSGWQIASNALMMYRHVDDRAADAPPTSFKPLHKLVLQQLGLLDRMGHLSDRDLRNFYMWREASPLRLYMEEQFPGDSTTDDFVKWASVGSMYNGYGVYLIRQHPMAYVRYYLLQGVDWFAVSDMDFTSAFAAGGYPVSEEEKNWFGYRSTWLPCTSHNIFPIEAFRFILPMLNLLMILSTMGFFIFQLHKQVHKEVTRVVLLAGCYWVLNFLFIIVSAPMVLRYAIPIMIFDIAFGLPLVEYIFRR